jgi:beta-glucanase (GH16 family)
MKRPSRLIHNARRAAIFLPTFSLLLLTGGSRPSAADVQGPDETPGVAVVVEARRSATPGEPGSLAGRVVDQRYKPVRGVRVRVPGRDAVTTGDKGEFSLRGLAATERLAVSFSAPGFMDTTRIYKVAGASRANVVIIWPRAAQVSMDAERGGRLTFPGGAVSFPPRALVDERGRPLRGKVKVAFSPLDVSDGNQLRSAPGDFTARMRNKTIRQLETFGVFEVFVEDAEGRRANLARGRKAAVELSIPRALRRGATKVVGLFSFDKEDGRWVEEGSLTRTRGAVFYAGSITNLLPSWNADNLLETTCIKVRILDCDCGEKLLLNQSSHVEAYGVNYSGISDGYTDPTTGEVCLWVKRKSLVSVIAHHPSLPNVQPLEIATPNHAAGVSDCGDPLNCPLVATTHIPAAAFDDYLNADDQTRWCKSGPWANGDPGFDVSWDNTTNHIDFPSGSGLMRLTLTDFGAATTLPCSNPGNCFGRSFASGEYRTKCFYGYGTYEAKLKTASPRGDGLVTTFFVYTGKPDGTIFDVNQDWHDEIDIEILGRASNPNHPKEPPCSPPNTLLQTNYFAKNMGSHEEYFCLPFDASQVATTYRFVWSQNDIKWYYDDPNNGTPVWMRTEIHQPGTPWPAQPGRIMVNTWAGNPAIQDVADWLGTFSYQGSPRQAQYDEIHYH